ncbi:ATP-binding protein [Leucobacter sp. OH1287]|uniref:ATP-binding protein n=1 Tax=Leucobacter sp. OH1287 TaxID=2491049 RepID=UPI000F5DB404|nr:ATP-binding protein [Leucobacter sp. OH1287]RRD60687.1 transcriptional regulator [Leucobacter sp. OH1287]
MLQLSGIPDRSELKAVIDHLRKVGADTRDVEVKAAGGGFPKSLLHTISAFSNTQGGLIILGLDEKTNFEPTPDFKAGATRKALEDACSNKIHPAVNAEIVEAPFADTVLLLAWIPELPINLKPAYIVTAGQYAGSYKRLGDGDHKLSNYEIDRLLENRSQPFWDREVVPRATLTDLDSQLLEQLLERERRLKPRNFASLSDEDCLRRLNIIDFDMVGELRPTLAGLLALGSYPQQFFPRLNITFTAYPGTDKASAPGSPRFLDNRRIDGSIPVILEETLYAVARNSRTGAVIVDGFRQDLPDFPHDAVREAVVNALMHRDYSPEARGSQVQVNLYTDRLEILNPGGLYSIVTLEALGATGLSATRNQALSNILESTPFENGFVAENRGSGYSAILTELQRAILPPPIPESTLTYFCLTFPRRGAASPEPPQETSAAKDRILTHLAKVPSATAKDVAASADIAVSTARATLSKLVKAGQIEMLEPPKSPKQRYRLTRRPPSTEPATAPSRPPRSNSPADHPAAAPQPTTPQQLTRGCSREIPVSQGAGSIGLKHE